MALEDTTMRKRKSAKIDLVAANFTDAEYAEWRQVKKKTLAAERCNGEGPPFFKVGRQVYYPIEGVKAHHAAVKPQDRAQEIARRRKAKRDAQAAQDSSAAVSP
jgi:hypothetical protein